MLNGGRVGFSRGSAELLDDVRLLRPTYFFSPPAFWSSLHQMYQQRLLALPSNLVRATSSIQLQLNACVCWKDAAARDASVVALDLEFSQMLGGRIKSLATGGAQTPDQVLAWIRRVFGALNYHMCAVLLNLSMFSQLLKYRIHTVRCELLSHAAGNHR